jgi:hypothetical protein
MGKMEKATKSPNRSNIYQFELFKKKLGFLYLDMNKERHWWQILVMCIKSITLIIGSFAATISPKAQVLLRLSLVSVYMALIMNLKP